MSYNDCSAIYSPIPAPMYLMYPSYVIDNGYDARYIYDNEL